MAGSKKVLMGGRWGGHLCVAGVVDQKGSKTGFSTRLLIVAHSSRRNSAGETERSSSGMTVVSEATGEERKNVLMGMGAEMGE